MDSVIRQWTAVAEEHGDGQFTCIEDSERVLDMSGVPKSKQVRILLIEDTEGELLGWIDTGSSEVAMVQHKRIFAIQFAYGPKAEVKRGNGEIVPLRAEKIENIHP